LKNFTPVPNTENTFYQEHCGNGGTAIYQADLDELNGLKSELAMLEGRKRKF